MATLTFSAVTPGGTAVSEDCESVTLPTADGEITVLPHHIPLVSVLIPGVVTYRNGTKESHLAVAGGFVQVTGEAVIVLADTAERADDIDAAKAERDRKAAEDRLAKRSEEADNIEAEAALKHSLARLKAADLRKRQRSGKA